MSPTAEQLYLSALSLPEEERPDLADALVAVSGRPSAPDSSGDEYADEVRRRSVDVDAAVWSSWADARQRAHARLETKGNDS